MLFAPSWGGMVNGLLTLRGAWDKVREEPVLQFMVVAVTAYGMATFEGPLLSIKSVNAISHYTDWTIAHVHVGALGWNGFLTFGMFYWLIPKLYGTTIYSKKLANNHFWIGTIGILFYAIPMYWAGFAESSMWKEFTPEGFLRYPNFLETVRNIIPMYDARAIGGLIYLVGVFIMIYNLWMTARQGKFIGDETAEAASLKAQELHGGHTHWHRKLERTPIRFAFIALIVIMIGGLIEMIPTFMIKSNIPTISSVTPYTPLELEGRDLYIREGCNTCHSQMIRPFRSETERYGEYSKAGEFVYDHPFLWGSKRTGPDLQREGNKYPNAWQYNHLVDPGSMSPGSIMPSYAWLSENKLSTAHTADKIHVMRKLGVPYADGYEAEAEADLKKQAAAIAKDLNDNGVPVNGDEEIIAIISYLQRLGTDIKKAQTVNNN